MALHPNNDAEQSSQTSINSDPIGRYLTTIIHSSINAINTRNLDPKRQPWTLYAPSFRNEPDGNSPIIGNLPTSFSGQRTMTLDTLLDFWKAMVAACPSFRIRIVEIEVCNVEAQEGTAEVALKAESLGIPDGVVRPSVSVLEFRRMSGRWLCTRMRTMPGVDFGGVGML